MAINPTNLTPSADTGGPYGGITTKLLRPRANNMLSGVTPAIPAFTPNDYQSQRTATQSIVATTVLPGSVLHFGDSQTECYDVLSVSPYSVNFGIGGDTAEAILYRLAYYAAPLKQARAICLMVGINNLRGGGNVATTKDMINRLVNWFSGPLVWSAIVRIASPQNEAYNANIDEVNAYIKGQLASRPQTAIVDINPIVAPAGPLLAAYHNGDGLHLSAAGYAVWSEAQRQALAKI